MHNNRKCGVHNDMFFFVKRLHLNASIKFFFFLRKLYLGKLCGRHHIFLVGEYIYMSFFFMSGHEVF